jgi:hypothetical protein
MSSVQHEWIDVAHKSCKSGTAALFCRYAPRNRKIRPYSATQNLGYLGYLHRRRHRNPFPDAAFSLNTCSRVMIHRPFISRSPVMASAAHCLSWLGAIFVCVNLADSALRPPKRNLNRLPKSHCDYHLLRALHEQPESDGVRMMLQIALISSSGGTLIPRFTTS